MYQRHITGQAGEELAVNYLCNQGYSILERNYRTRWGEIDIVAKDKDTMYFFEVKTRHSNQYGHPFEAVSYRKRRAIQRAAWAYLLKHKPTYHGLALGVVGVQLYRGSSQPHISHIPNIGWLD